MLRMATIALLLAAATPASVLAQAIPPAGYTFQPAPPCLEDAEKASRPLRPGAAVYQVCADQMAVFAKGIAEAKASRKLLLATFGATWCPWCAALQKAMPTTELLARKGDALDYGAAFHHIEIGVSTLHKGQKSQIPSGDAVLRHVLSKTNGVKIRIIPFLAVIDPNNPDRVYARNLDDVAQADGSHDLGRFRALLVEAHAHLRGKGAGPVEPSWLKRQWMRFWPS